jgi:hypothetical protein
MANAELLKNFKYNGTVEVNAYNINNADFNKNADDKIGDVDTRVMINAGFDLNDDVNAVVSVVKNNRQWGTGSENANAIQNNLFFEQAYLNLKGVLGMDHKLGRQYYGNPNDLVIYYGPKMWPYNPTLTVAALDAWTGVYKYNDFTFTGLLAKESNAGAAPDKDVNISGIDLKTKIDVFNLNAYYYNKNNKATGTSDYLGVLGTRANWECKFVKGLNLALEYDKNLGKNDATNVKHTGYAYKANVDYTMDLMGKLGFDGEYTFMSGDKTSTKKVFVPINTDYRPGIIANGFGLDLAYEAGFVNGGIITYGIGLNWTPEKLSKMNIAAKYYNFSSDKEVNTDKNVGNEYDIVATWKHSDNVSLKGYYAMFKPEKDNWGTDDMETAFGAAFVVKF